MAGVKLQNQREKEPNQTTSKFYIMHAKVFQITCERVDKENTLNEDTLTQGDGSFYDYCSEITPEFRKAMIVILVNEILPKGMFTLIEDDEIVYNGGSEEWKSEGVNAIRD